MDIFVPLADLDFDIEEENGVLDVLRRRWLTMGSVTQAFEQEFADYVGAKHAFAVGNGTLALHLACLALGIGPGDEVIVPSLTFVATSNVILYQQARPVFADISSSDDLTISPTQIEALITPHTKAIMVMHYGGYPCQMEKITAIAKEHNLAVIEDAAHAPGANIDGKALGTWSDVGCFSFFSNKNLATGEGGIVVTNRDDLAEKIRILRSHGMTTLTWDRHQGHAYSYDVVDLGYNYRIDEIRASLGLSQLHKLNRNNARRQEITKQYRAKLPAVDAGITLPFNHLSGQPSYHIFPMLLTDGTDRQVFMVKMREAGVQTSIHYPPIHKFSYYQKRFPGVSLPITEAVATCEVTLPLFPGMTDTQVVYVVSAVKKALYESKVSQPV